MCLKPIRIRRNETIIEKLEFDGGTRLLVADAIALQDAGAIVVTGYQLTHPKDYNAYYRARADFIIENNLERLLEFACAKCVREANDQSRRSLDPNYRTEPVARGAAALLWTTRIGTEPNSECIVHP